MIEEFLRIVVGCIAFGILGALVGATVSVVVVWLLELFGLLDRGRKP